MRLGGVLHQGRVTRLRPPEADEDPDDEVYYEVTYEDEDVEDYTREDLLPLLQLHAESDFRHLRGADGEGAVGGQGADGGEGADGEDGGGAGE